MTKFYKCFIWFYMLTKRLLLKKSFVMLLLLIPCLISFLGVSSSSDSGILKIVLVNEGNDILAKNAVEYLLNEESIINFSYAATKEEALKMVNSAMVDSAWIFPDDLTERVKQNLVSAETIPLVTTYQKELTVPLRIADEKLFNALYKDNFLLEKGYDKGVSISYLLYEDFVLSEIDGSIPKEELMDAFYSSTGSDSIFVVERLETNTPDTSKINYLNAPLRGLLAVMIVLCSLTAALFFIREQADGKFDWLSPETRIVPAVASCFSASLISSVAVFISISIAGISTGILNEIINLLLLVLSSCGFCSIFASLFKNPGKFGAIIPGLIILMIVLSPIFFNFKMFGMLRVLLPTHYYLNTIYNPMYIVKSLIYCFCTYFILFVINLIKKADA